MPRHLLRSLYPADTGSSPQPRAGGRRVQLPCGAAFDSRMRAETMQRASCSRGANKQTSVTAAQIGGHRRICWSRQVEEATSIGGCRSGRLNRRESMGG